jgi:2-polyprenyl-6-methoxyphenol hydroxylase-like FAD-dependent oxidoreductase
MGPKIAVIGGGIAGLTTAVALARRGLVAEVYEQAPVLEEAGAGVGLWPNAMMALEPIGLAGAVARLAVDVARQDLRRPDGTVLTRIPGDLMAKRWGVG